MFRTIVGEFLLQKDIESKGALDNNESAHEIEFLKRMSIFIDNRKIKRLLS